MPGDKFSKVAPGQQLRIPADTYNAFIDAALAHQASGANPDPAERDIPDTDIILVRNQTGAPLDRFNVVGLDVPLITPSDNLDAFKAGIALDGVVPAADTHNGNFAVMLEPVGIGEIGQAMVSGVVVCQVNKIEADDSWADVKDSDVTTLQSATTGSAYILWSEAGTGTKWSVVRLSNSSGLQLFELKDDLKEQDTISAAAWKISITDVQGWSRDNTTADHTVYAAPSFRGYAFGVPAGQEATLCGTIVAAVRIRGRWQAVAGGSTCYESTAVGAIPAGGMGDIDINVGQSCIHRVPATNLGFSINGGESVLAFFCQGGWYVLGTVLEPPGLNPGCGLKFQAGSPNIWQVDNVALAGPGLKTWGTCGLEVDLSPTAGCGLKDEGGGTLAIDPPVIAGSGLKPGAGCSVDVDLVAGCGISINGNEISVDSSALAGNGLTTAGACGLAVVFDPGSGLGLIGGQLQVLAGCGIKIDGVGRVSFDPNDVAGIGLRAAANCSLEVDAACGLSFDSAGRLRTDGLTQSYQLVTDIDENEYGDLVITKKTFSFVCGVLKTVT